MLTTILLASLVASANALTTTTTSPPGPTDPPVMEYWYNQIRTVTKYDLCVGPKGAPKGGPQSWADGTPVILQKCVYNDYKTRIHINGGDGQVFPVGSDLCFDAGENPGNGSKVKVWKCYPGLKQQQWFLTGDGRIALTNQGLCLDVVDGVFQAGKQLQVWECATGNTNQAFQASEMISQTPPEIPAGGKIPNVRRGPARLDLD